MRFGIAYIKKQIPNQQSRISYPEQENYGSRIRS